MGGCLEGIRILHVHTLPVISGSGINTLLTMRGSLREGAHVALAVAPGGELAREVERSGMRVFPIRHFVSELSPFKDLSALWQVHRLLARERFDIVHTHNSKAGFIGRLAAWRQGVPIIVHTVHGFAFHGSTWWLFRRLYACLERRAARWCHQMIAISQPMIEWAEAEGIARREEFVKIYSGIELDRFRHAAPSERLLQELGIREGSVRVGVVSKLWEGKGHEVLLRAVKRLAERDVHFQLLVVGEGPLEGQLKELVHRLGLEERVFFTGFRPDVPEITALLDISVLPSFYEGMGRVVLEAMAAGKPVVASRVGGVPDLVEDGVNGFLVPAGDEEVLADRMGRLIRDPRLRLKMGRLAADTVGEVHSAQTMVRQIHEVYQVQLERVGLGSALGREKAQ